MAKLYTAIPTTFKLRDFFIVLAAGFLGVVIQNTWAAWLGLGSYGPEWVLILTVYAALKAEFWLAILTAFLLGFIRDAVGGGFMGLYQVDLMVLAWLFHRFRGLFNFFNPLALIPLVFALSLAGSLFIITPIMAIFGWSILDVSPLSFFFVSALTSALASAPVFAFLDFLTRSKERGRHV